MKPRIPPLPPPRPVRPREPAPSPKLIQPRGLVSPRPVPPPALRQAAPHVVQMTKAVHSRPVPPSRLPSVPVHFHRAVVQRKTYDMFGRKLDTADEPDIVQYIVLMDRINHDRLREFRKMLMEDIGTLDAAGVRTVRRLNAILGDLPVSTGQPPATWAVVDAHLPTGALAPFWKMPSDPPTFKRDEVYGVTDEQNLARYVYRSSTGWDVNLYWPKAWAPPATNRLNMIPNGEFGDALGGLKSVQPSHVLFSYTAYTGGTCTPTVAYVAAGPKKEPEKDDNYYAYQEEYQRLDSALDNGNIEMDEFESLVAAAKIKYKQ